MKTKLILYFALNFIFLFAAKAQIWENTYGTPTLGEQATDLVETTNGDIIVVGLHATNSQFIAVRISPDGEEIWQQIYSLLLSPDAILNAFTVSITQASDGGYILAWSEIYENSINSQYSMYKINDNGTILWSKGHLSPSEVKIYDISATADGGYILAGSTDTDFLETQVVVAKMDVAGDTLWTRSYFNNSTFTQAREIIELPEGGYILTGVDQGNTLLLKLDANGNSLWNQNFPGGTGESICLSPDGGYAIASNQKLIKTDIDGNIMWEYEAGDEESFKSIAPTNDGGYICTGTNLLPIVGFVSGHVIGLKLYEDGSTDWRHDFSSPYLEAALGTVVLQASDGNYIFAGFAGTDVSSLDQILVIKSAGYPFKLSGNVFIDENFNCINDNETVWLLNSVVTVSRNEQTYYLSINENGEYRINLDSLEYTVNLIVPDNGLWTACQENTLIDFTTSDDVELDLGLQSLFDCPSMMVDISTPFLRRCFENTYTVFYGNSGTTLAENSSVDITLDTYLTYLSSSIPFASVDGNTYTFELGNLDIGEIGNFQITTFLDCDSTILGQTHCTTAHIFPDTICTPIDPNWDGSIVEVDAICTQDQISFFIKNVGNGDMLASKDFIITEDVIMYDMGDFQLGSGQMQQFDIPTNGATYRLMAQQVDGYPGNSNPSVFVEGCVPFGDDFSIGFPNMFPEDDEEAFISIDCQENIGSYDPNDKRGFPKGYGEEYFILKFKKPPP